MAAFEFATANRIVFGAGQCARVGELAREMGARRVLVVGGRSGQRTTTAVAALDAAGLETAIFAVAGEPSVEVAREGTRQAVEFGAEAVVAIGGGSVLDGGKAIAALAANGGDPLDYLEVVGRGQPLVRPSLPFLAVPTTAGTGSEVTRNAVLTSTEHGVKASLRSALMLPRLALVDPDLLAGAPREVMASSGLDAFSQLVEPFLSQRAQPLTDALAREGILRSARSLRRACLAEPDAAAREDLALASLFGGLCLANAGLGAVHGFAAPIGGLFHAPHGAVCAALLPAVLEVNHAALAARAPAHPSLRRFHELAALVTGDEAALPADGVAWVRGLCRDLAVPGLMRYGVGVSDIPRLVEKGRAASSMRGNPIELTDAELATILRRSL